MREKLCFGVDIGGTKTAVIAGRERSGDIEILERAAFPSSPENPETTLAGILRAPGILCRRLRAPPAPSASHAAAPSTPDAA